MFGSNQMSRKEHFSFDQTVAEETNIKSEQSHCCVTFSNHVYQWFKDLWHWMIYVHSKTSLTSVLSSFASVSSSFSKGMPACLFCCWGLWPASSMLIVVASLLPPIRFSASSNSNWLDISRKNKLNIYQRSNVTHVQMPLSNHSSKVTNQVNQSSTVSTHLEIASENY